MEAVGKRVRKVPERFQEREPEKVEEREKRLSLEREAAEQLREEERILKEERARLAAEKRAAKAALAAEAAEAGGPVVPKIPKPKAKRKADTHDIDYYEDSDGEWRATPAGRAKKARAKAQAAEPEPWTWPLNKFYNRDPRRNSAIVLQRNSKSGRAGCQRCGRKIELGSFRVGYESTMDTEYGNFMKRDIVRFMHAECFARFPPQYCRKGLEAVNIERISGTEDDNDDYELRARLRDWWAPPPPPPPAPVRKPPPPAPVYLPAPAPVQVPRPLQPAPAAAAAARSTPAPALALAPASSDPRKKHYAVVQGHTVGIFASNASFTASLRGKGSGKGKGFPTLGDAQRWYKEQTGLPAPPTFA